VGLTLKVGQSIQCCDRVIFVLKLDACVMKYSFKVQHTNGQYKPYIYASMCSGFEMIFYHKTIVVTLIGQQFQVLWFF